VNRVLFFALGIACLYPALNPPEQQLAFVPPVALLAGMALALTLGNPFPSQTKTASKWLLQGAVVLLGFSMDLQKILQAGLTGISFALASILAVYGLGWWLSKTLKVRPMTSLLVSTGTAICGGSAIAAIASVTDAPQEDVSVAVGTIFLLNAVALVLFPPIGHALGMTSGQFGIWSGIAIHDVSSVVGAATAFGKDSLEAATAVKLSRVLYLIPITIIATAWLARQKSAEDGTSAKMQIPWFIGLFLLASLSRTWLLPVQSAAPTIKLVAVAGFSLSLFLIGCGIGLKTLKSVGVRPMAEGLILWAFISVAALVAARSQA
jgi:uncharacterized integral membrane protein (TIGR00698 family)